MAQTGIVINKESWAVLREEPLYSARFIDREGTEELALVIRVEVLDFFLDASLPLALDLTTWQSPQEIWVVAISYRLHPTFGSTQTGVFYLNPRQLADAELLRKLLQQETLSVIFLSADCEEHYTVGVVLDPQALGGWRQQLDEINQVKGRKTFTDEVDADFELAMRELQAQHGQI